MYSKKLLIFPPPPIMLISIILMLLLATPLLADGWEGRINDPCPPFQDSVGWSVPFDTTFCVKDLPPKLQQCDTTCCYTIVYYEAANENENPPDDYAVNVAGIIWTEGSGCDTCGIPGIIRGFMYSLIERKCNEDPTFLGRDSLNMPDTIPIYEYDKGKCFNGEVECEPEINRCCRSTYYCYFDSQGNFIGMSDPIVQLPQCPELCLAQCNQIPFLSYDSLNCNLPCTSGNWEYHDRVIPISNCPLCNFIIHYRTRRCEPEGFLDMRIDKLDTFNCVECEEDLFLLGLKWMLNEGANNIIGPDLGDDECDTTLRLSYAACWGWGWGPYDHSYHYVPCTYSACCWKTYIVCLHDTITTELFDSGVYGEDTCNWVFPDVCEFKCDVVIPRVAAFDFETDKRARDNVIPVQSFAVPNPSTGNIDIHFVSSKQGEYIIEIIDIYGSEINKTRFNKKATEAILPFDMSGNSSGIYFYRIKSQECRVANGSFSIIK